MSGSLELAENVIGAMTSIGGINDARNSAEMVSSIGQALGYLGAITLSPITAGAAIATNAGAASATLGKVLSDLKNDRKVDVSDLASIAGNAAVISVAVGTSINPASNVAKVLSAIARGIGWIGTSKYLIDKAHASEKNPIDSLFSDPFNAAQYCFFHLSHDLA